ncbi:hypothetical protein DIE18_03500 [Burkholderia sp. Bp9125]|nr:hypothetical protein DIE18_03500 [Burkholderia sp. Bp9125]
MSRTRRRFVRWGRCALLFMPVPLYLGYLSHFGIRGFPYLQYVVLLPALAAIWLVLEALLTEGELRGLLAQGAMAGTVVVPLGLAAGGASLRVMAIAAGTCALIFVFAMFMELTAGWAGVVQAHHDD